MYIKLAQDLPAFLFVFGGYYNFKQIRSDGINRVVNFSKLFKMKRLSCLAMAGINLINFVVILF